MSTSTTVQLRNVYYFSGFDPRGPAYYLRLFRKESRKAGFTTDYSHRADHDLLGKFFLRWEANCYGAGAPPSCAPGEHIVVNHFFMKWDDIIKAH